jgi:HEPN domain-containing protein
MDNEKQALLASRWTIYAEEDLASAEKMLTDAPFVARQAAFLAQQAAEKFIKAALIFLGRDFPFSHDLNLLRGLLPSDWSIHQLCPDLAVLSAWVIQGRYPGDLMWPTEADNADAREAVQLATRVRDALITDLVRIGYRPKEY